MIRPLTRFLSRVFFVVSVVCLLTANAGGTDLAVRLPSDRDTCFALHAFVNTNYHVFRKDGTYKALAREHFGVSLWDRGSWKQDRSGVLTLHSEMLLRNVKCGALTIEVAHVTRFREMARLKSDIQAFLANSNASSYSSDEITKAWTYTYRPYDEASAVSESFQPIVVAPGTKAILRSHVEELLEAWDRYLRDDERNVRHITPIALRGKTFLISDDDPLVRCKSLADLRQKIALWGSDRSIIPYVYMMIPNETYALEASVPQPFLFIANTAKDSPAPRMDEPPAAVKAPNSPGQGRRTNDAKLAGAPPGDTKPKTSK